MFLMSLARGIFWLVVGHHVGGRPSPDSEPVATRGKSRRVNMIRKMLTIAAASVIPMTGFVGAVAMNATPAAAGVATIV